MDTKAITEKIKQYYKNSLEKGALLNEYVFSNKDTGLIFFVEMRTLISVASISEDRDYFTDSPVQKLYIKVNNLEHVKEILTELGVIKQNTDNILFKILHFHKVEKDNPFYLVINIFKTLGV